MTKQEATKNEPLTKEEVKKETQKTKQKENKQIKQEKIEENNIKQDASQQNQAHSLRQTNDLDEFDDQPELQVQNESQIQNEKDLEISLIAANIQKCWRLNSKSIAFNEEVIIINGQYDEMGNLISFNNRTSEFKNYEDYKTMRNAAFATIANCKIGENLKYSDIWKDVTFEFKVEK